MQARIIQTTNNMPEQTQESRDNCLNIQIHSEGVTVSEARQIAKDVFNANFYRLSKEAAELASYRAEQFTEKLLRKLETEGNEALRQARDPDYQYVLFNAQRDIARRSEANLEDLLVDLLVDRACEPDQTLEKIILNEALGTIPKLTFEQIDLISLIFSVSYATFPVEPIREAVVLVLQEIVNPLVSKVNLTNITSYRHLAFLGCGGGSGVNHRIGKKLKAAYPAVFSKSEPDEAIEKYIVNSLSFGNQLVSSWNETPVSSTNLTSVGIAIAQANIRRKHGLRFMLSDWV